MSALQVKFIAISMSLPPAIVLPLPFFVFMIYLEYDTCITAKIVFIQLLQLFKIKDVALIERNSYIYY